MPGDPQVIAGAAIGIAATLVLAFGLVTALDGRYTTRREFDATLRDIRGQLSDIKKAVTGERD